MVLRLAWSQYPHNVRLALAANIFVQAGTLLLYVINLVFAQRIIRAQHPRLGWNKAVSIASRILVALVIATLIIIIAVVVQSFYTLDASTRYIDHSLQLFGVTLYAVVAFLPIPMVIIGLVLPRRIRTEKFGQGRFRTKVTVLIAATLLAVLRAGFSAGVAWAPPVPLQDSTPWFLSKAALYLLDFVPEILIVYLYAAVRVDRRFHVPNKSRGSYMGKSQEFNFGSEDKLAQEKAHQFRDSNVSVLGALPVYTPRAEPPEPQRTGSSRAGQIGRSVWGLLRRQAQTQRAIAFPYLQGAWNDSEVLRIYSEDELFDDPATLGNTLRYSNVYQNTSLSRDNLTGKWELKRHSSQRIATATPSIDGSLFLSAGHPSEMRQNSIAGGTDTPSVCEAFGDRNSAFVQQPHPARIRRSRHTNLSIDTLTNASQLTLSAASARTPVYMGSVGMQSNRSRSSMSTMGGITTGEFPPVHATSVQFLLPQGRSGIAHDDVPEEEYVDGA